MATCCINDLPTELLLQILDDVTDPNGRPPSDVNFSLEPSANLTKSASRPLKTLSLVSKRWREAVLPSLFRHASVTFSAGPWGSKSCSSLRTDLQQSSQSPHSPPQEGEINQFLDFLTLFGLLAKVRTLVVYASEGIPSERSNHEQSLFLAEVKSFWRIVFRKLSLEQIIVAAPPSLMIALSGAIDHRWDEWLFKMPWHYLRLSRNASTSNLASTSFPRDPGTPVRETFLYNIAPWDHMAYNEGTHLRGYGHYEYQWTVPPAIFINLLDWLAKEKSCLRTPTIESVEYICAYPYSKHIFSLAQALAKQKTVRELKVKLADPDLLSIPELIGKGQPSDVYSEWEECYHHIARTFLAPADRETKLIAEDWRHATLRDQVQRCIERRTLMPHTYDPVLEEEDGVMTWTVNTPATS